MGNSSTLVVPPPLAVQLVPNASAGGLTAAQVNALIAAFVAVPANAAAIVVAAAGSLGLVSVLQYDLTSAQINTLLTVPVTIAPAVAGAFYGVIAAFATKHLTVVHGASNSITLSNGVTTSAILFATNMTENDLIFRISNRQLVDANAAVTPAGVGLVLSSTADNTLGAGFVRITVVYSLLPI